MRCLNELQLRCQCTEKEMRLGLARSGTSDNRVVQTSFGINNLALVHSTLAVPEILCSLIRSQNFDRCDLSTFATRSRSTMLRIVAAKMYLINSSAGGGELLRLPPSRGAAEAADC